MLKLLSIFFMGLAIFQGAYAAGGIFINEFVAGNTSGIQDEAGQYEDWIELYNSNNFEVNLSGWHMTDDPNEPTKWTFPANVVIPAKGFLYVWADDDLKHGPLHTNFKLSKDGEYIGLYLPGAVMVGDSLSFGSQVDNKSIGRMPDGSSDFRVFDYPTPGSSNAGTSVEGEQRHYLTVYPNPANNYIYIPQNLQSKIYNASGDLVLESNGEERLDISKLSSGAYIINILNNKKLQSIKFIKK